MARQDNLGGHFLGTSDCRVEVVDLKPEEHAVPVRLRVGVPYRAVMVFHFPLVQLQHQLASGDQPFVIGTAMVALTAQQPLIPATAGFDIAHADERLWPHYWLSPIPPLLVFLFLFHLFLLFPFDFQLVVRRSGLAPDPDQHEAEGGYSEYVPHQSALEK